MSSNESVSLQRFDFIDTEYIVKQTRAHAMIALLATRIENLRDSDVDEAILLFVGQPRILF